MAAQRLAALAATKPIDNPLSRANEVALELKQVQKQFREGETGQLVLWLDRRLTDDELQHIAQEINGQAFHLTNIGFSDTQNALVLDFQVGVLFLPIIAAVVGLLGVGIVGWVLRKRLHKLALPIALGTTGVIGAGAAYFLRSKPKVAIVCGVASTGLIITGLYLGWRALFPPPVVEVEFKDLTAEYWSEAAAGKFAPKKVVPVIDGWKFGGTLHFKHKGPASKYLVGFWCNVEGNQVWAGPNLVEVTKDDGFKDYSVDVEGIFSRGKLGVCRRIDTVKVIASESGNSILEDGDTECYHVAEVPAMQVTWHERSWIGGTPSVVSPTKILGGLRWM